jgi:hypothetical protein
MSEKPKRLWFRFHLLTAVVTMVIASILLWLNTRTVSDFAEVPVGVHALFHGTISVNADHKDAQNVFRLCLGKFPYEVFIDADDLAPLTLKLMNVKPSAALDEAAKTAGLQWTLVGEGIYIAKPADVAWVRGMTALDSVTDPVMRRALARKMTFCSPGELAPIDAVEYLSNMGHLTVVSRIPDAVQRFGFDFRDMALKNSLRMLAVCYNADLIVENGTIVFVPRHANVTGVAVNKLPQESDWYLPRICRNGWPFAFREYEEYLDQDVTVSRKPLILDILVNCALLLITVIAIEYLHPGREGRKP